VAFHGELPCIGIAATQPAHVGPTRLASDDYDSSVPLLVVLRLSTENHLCPASVVTPLPFLGTMGSRRLCVEANGRFHRPPFCGFLSFASHASRPYASCDADAPERIAVCSKNPLAPPRRAKTRHSSDRPKRRTLSPHVSRLRRATRERRWRFYQRPVTTNTVRPWYSRTADRVWQEPPPASCSARLVHA